MRYTLEVEPFDSGFMDTQADKALALKPLEEAAEAFGAWQRYDGDEWDDTDGDLERMLLDDIADELADTVQACVNLADRGGLDLRAALARVHERNVGRGRYGLRQCCDSSATELRSGCEGGAKPCAEGARRDLKPKWLTHTRPDSWEQLESEAVQDVCAYFGFLNKSCNDGDGCPANKPGDCAKFKVLDIIRRAKALAGVEVDE